MKFIVLILKKKLIEALNNCIDEQISAMLKWKRQWVK